MVLRQIARSSDFWSGVMFFLFGAAAVYVARDYPMGAAMRMGPGYFPTYLGVLLMIFGLIIGVRGALASGEAIGRWALRPLVVLGASILAFAYAGLHGASASRIAVSLSGNAVARA